MVGIILYILACFAVALVLTMLYAMFRSIKSRDELKSWRVLLFMYIFALSAPYLYAEVMTRVIGAHMEAAVNLALDDAGITGNLSYYKVVAYNGETARVVAVAHQKSKWGGVDDPTLAITLRKKGGGWSVDSYLVISSETDDVDGFTFPPYF